MIANVVIPWLLAAAVLFLPAGYFPPVLRRMFRGLSVALAGGAMFLAIASLIYVWPDCSEVPWWILWCDWNNVNNP